jgi:TRAP-type mannitol/chloroaromatic compound transport system permease small subunit
MAMQAASPLVQVITQPSFVISHLHVAIIMLTLQQTMPFIMQQQEHMLPAIMVQRFCIMAQATVSSHLHVIFIPSFIFSTIILQRGTIIMLGAIGEAEPGIGLLPMLGIPIPIPVRSIIIVPVIILTS